MKTRQPANTPVALSAARQQFDQWRSRHHKRARLPKELWRQAAALAREHGLNKTARALGLGYYSLKNGARVGDLFMSLIHTCELNKVNPFDYSRHCRSTPTRCPQNPTAGCPGTTEIHSQGPTPPDKFRFFSGLPKGHICSDVSKKGGRN